MSLKKSVIGLAIICSFVFGGYHLAKEAFILGYVKAYMDFEHLCLVMESGEREVRF